MNREIERVIEHINGKKEVILSQPSLADLMDIALDVFEGTSPNQLKLFVDFDRAIHFGNI